MNHQQSSWICCQLGAREHYAIPRALAQKEMLKVLITDTWIEDNHPLNLLPKSYLASLRSRYHPELQSASIKAVNNAQIAWELAHKSQQTTPWDKIIAQNSWWQKKALQILDKYQSHNNVILFSYSYGALKLFQYAKKRGWKTVLGQIDPGIVEEKLVVQKTKKHSHLQSAISTPPLQYWSDWRQECALADRIIVNSNWSNLALQQTGITPNKIKTIPLAYQISKLAKEFKRSYRDRFDHNRPMRVMFLGQVIIRKGIAEILEAIALLSNQPIEFWFVGKVNINVPKSFKNHPQVKWYGTVSRSTTSYYYQQADIFLLPTHSDGFGLTQLEAQAWKLPLITSQYCGEVVKDRINGLILPNITGEAIAKALTFCLHNPQKLAEFSQNSLQILADFSLNKLAQELQNIDIT